MIQVEYISTITGNRITGAEYVDIGQARYSLRYIEVRKFWATVDGKDGKYVEVEVDARPETALPRFRRSDATPDF